MAARCKVNNERCFALADCNDANVDRDISDVQQPLAADRIAALWHLAVIAQPNRRQVTAPTIAPMNRQLIRAKGNLFDIAHADLQQHRFELFSVACDRFDVQPCNLAVIVITPHLHSVLRVTVSLKLLDLCGVHRPAL